MFKGISKNHISLLCSKDIKEICQHFFKQHNLNHLNYFRLYYDNTVFYLCSNYDWLKHYYDCSYPAIGAFEQNHELANYRYVLWAGLDEKDVILKDTREIFNVYHGITLIKKHKNYTEYYNIGTSDRQQSILNFFINNCDKLLKFTKMFDEKSNKLIRASSSQRLILPDNPIKQANKTPYVVNSKFCAKTTFEQANGIPLTKTELLCLKLYFTENATSDIANILGISKRTVEKHFENIRNKFNCKNQFQLGYLLAKADIDIG